MQRLEALGYAVEEASDVASAIETLHTCDAVDLVLSDISMPGSMNGFGFRDRLAVEMPHLPVVLITAHEELVSSEGLTPILSKFCSRP